MRFLILTLLLIAGTSGNYKQLKNRLGKLEKAFDQLEARGPEGDRGPKGDRGAMGPAGEPGIDGWKGMSGWPGENGRKGDQGPPGKNGIPGRKGEPGHSVFGDCGYPSDCSRGEKGDTGDDGRKGFGGETGEKGIKGAMGKDGMPGFMGSSGEKGESGSNPRLASIECEEIQSTGGRMACDEISYINSITVKEGKKYINCCALFFV